MGKSKVFFVANPEAAPMLDDGIVVIGDFGFFEQPGILPATFEVLLSTTRVKRP